MTVVTILVIASTGVIFLKIIIHRNLSVLEFDRLILGVAMRLGWIESFVSAGGLTETSLRSKAPRFSVVRYEIRAVYCVSPFFSVLPCPNCSKASKQFLSFSWIEILQYFRSISVWGGDRLLSR